MNPPLAATLGLASWLLVGCGSATPSPKAAAQHIAPIDSVCARPTHDQAVIHFGTTALTPICSDVYVDPATSAADQDRLMHSFPKAWEAVRVAFGSVSGPAPTTIFCKTAPCVADFAGPTRRSSVIGPGSHKPGAIYTAGNRPTVVMSFEDPGAESVLVHEMVHIETEYRLGGARVPEWFSEGLAFSIANQRTGCAGVPRAIDDLRRLDRGWAEFTNMQFQKKMVASYCQAGAELDAWLHRRGQKGLVGLLDTVRHGGAFDDAYGPMLTQSADGSGAVEAPDDQDITLENATVGFLTLNGELNSFARTSGIEQLSDPKKPFSITLWVKPAQNAGTLVHVSSEPNGAGWCTPFIGYSSTGHIVAQVIHGTGTDPSQFSVAETTTSFALDTWTHVAMTWAPLAPTRLYINGVESGEAPPAPFNAEGGGPMRYVTWGSSNAKGKTACWQGAIQSGGFKGSLGSMSVYGRELRADEIAAMARSRKETP